MSHAGYEKTRLQKLLDGTPFKTVYFAEQLRMTPGQFRYFARNPRGVTNEQAHALAEILGLTFAEVIAVCREVDNA